MEIKRLAGMNLPLVLNDVFLSETQQMMVARNSAAIAASKAPASNASSKFCALPACPSLPNNHNDVLAAAIEMASDSPLAVNSNLQHQLQYQRRPQVQLRMDERDMIAARRKSPSAAVPSQPSQTHKRPRQQATKVASLPLQSRFLLQVKVLLRHLRRHSSPELYKQAKEVVSTCVKRNRRGDINFTPLRSTLEVLLHELVGDANWKYSKLLTRHILSKKGRKRQDYTTRSFNAATAISTLQQQQQQRQGEYKRQQEMIAMTMALQEQLQQRQQLQNPFGIAGPNIFAQI